ncbi:MAG TPA: BamA/TamA family outer membrane protein [Gemmatimonadales bacterium]|nr:BamA/TamA family outer membrane protein [Gemmatimonadales bacterium]
MITLFFVLAVPFSLVQDTTIVIHPESASVSLEALALPRVVSDEVITFYNAPGTTRLVGRTRLPRGNEWRGDVAVRSGPVLVAGRVQGSLVVINGDLRFDTGAEVTGNVIVVGGIVDDSATAHIGGELRQYREPLLYRLRKDGDEIVYAPNLRRRLWNPGAEVSWGTADSRSALTIATGGTFNRVEGLPIVFGPLFDWKLERNFRMRVDALGVFRSAGDLSDKRSDLGYMFRSELRSGDARPVGLALRAFDIVSPIEDWGLKNSEIGWSSFLFARDYRDYYLNKGWAARAFAQAERPITLSLELRREWQTSVSQQDPWTIFRHAEAWRPNPSIDDGHYTTLAAGAVLDTRNDPDEPTSGWLVRTTLENSWSHDVIPNPGVPTAVRDSIPTGSYSFDRLFFDIRHYARISPGGRVNVRLVGGGWVGGDALPLQHRFSLGGPDPMPGYPFRVAACNNAFSDSTLSAAHVAACDRVIAFQTEYRGHVKLNWSYDPRGEEKTDRDETSGPSLFWLEGLDVVVFADAGQGWLVGNGPGRVPPGHLPAFSSWLVDAGLGVDWGGFGVYIAKAVTTGEHLRFTVRLDHRF